MKRVGARPRARRLWVILGLLGLFILSDLVLFAFLIFQTLSRRELDRVLLETRSEAQSLAGRLAGSAERAGGDLFTAVALEQETQTYIDSVLRQRQIVQTVEITDKNGVLVMKERRELEIASPAGIAAMSPTSGFGGGQELPSAIAAPHVESRTIERQDTQKVALPTGALEGLDVTVPIGQFGSLRIGLSPFEMERRIGALRRDLVRQTAVLGSVTLLVVVLAVAVISVLARRGQRLATKAAEAERLADLGKLAAGLAHEIRNPLNSLNLNMQMLEEDLARSGRGGGVSPTAAAEPPESARDRRGKLFDITRAEIGRLDRLVTDFLSFARPRPLELRTVSAREILDRVRGLVSREFALSGAALETVDESDGAAVRVDPEPMQQLLLNLLQNALAATEASGRERRVKLAARRVGLELRFEVSDNGIGIAPDDQERIFEIFYSTKKGGTGLGLAIADRVARAHAGEIDFESTPGTGTTFRVALPVATGHAPVA